MTDGLKKPVRTIKPKLFVAQPPSTTTVEEMTTHIYEHCQIGGYSVRGAITDLSSERNESPAFVRYCIGRMMLAGIPFKR